MKLDPLDLDKNGCTELIACWCYKCTGGSVKRGVYTMMAGNKGKGKMIYINEQDFPKDESQRYRYECISCGYSFNYTKTYVEKYAIR